MTTNCDHGNVSVNLGKMFNAHESKYIYKTDVGNLFNDYERRNITPCQNTYNEHSYKEFK